MKIDSNINKLKNKKNTLSTHASIKNWVAMLRIRKVGECEELCRKRIELEKTLGVREISYEKCINICRAFAI
jgi:hypothetical protein